MRFNLMTEKLPELPKQQVKPLREANDPTARRQQEALNTFERERKGGWRVPVCDGCQTRFPTMIMVVDEIWKQISKHPKEILCKGCIETRLGRLLTLDDLRPCLATEQSLLGAAIAKQSLDKTTDVHALAKALYRRHAIDSVTLARNVDEVKYGHSPKYDPADHELTDDMLDTVWMGEESVRKYWLQIANAAILFMRSGSLYDLPKPLVKCGRCRDLGHYREYDDAIYASARHAEAANAVKERLCDCEAGRRMRQQRERKH